MPSQLTRQVFRRLLANEPITHSGCLRRQRYYGSLASTKASRPVVRRRNGVSSFTKHVSLTRRTFLNLSFFGAPKQNRRDADLDPGIDVMMDLVRRQGMSARLPLRAKVREALVQFVKAKYEQEGVVEDTQAELLLPSVKYILEDEALYAGDGLSSWLQINKLATILLRQPKQTCNAHVELARSMFELNLPSTPHSKVLGAFCNILCFAGKPEQARELVLQYRMLGEASGSGTGREAESQDAQQSPSEDMDDAGELSKNETIKNSALRFYLVGSWKTIARTFALQGNEHKLLETRNMAQERAFTGLWDLETMVQFYIGQDNKAQVEQAWKEYWSFLSQMKDHSKGGITVDLLLKWCAKEQHIEFGHSVVRDVLTTTPPKAVWDAIFIWAASTGKGVDEINRMIGVMEASAQDSEKFQTPLRPDIETINGLIEMAISRNDPYMAERFISLGKDRGIQPDAKTFVLQINYRLGVNDVDGALTAYKNLQAGETGPVEDDAAAVNKLIVALCGSKVHDFDTVMNVAADLSDRRVRFEPLTVSKLTLLHLSRDEIPDVIDLLNTHAFHYSLAERASIRETLITAALDLEIPAARAWDSYMICREVFDELPREPRTRIMSAFFERNRADIAVHVFSHMRAHTRADTIPDITTYSTAFDGIGKLGDIESLELIHNQLKLDFNINLNTHIRNVLIAAYTACDGPRQGLTFWDDIVASREGPNYNSIHLALRACEASPFGASKAQQIWAKLRSRSVQLDSSMWASYAAALVGNGDVKLAISTIEEAESKGELDVDAFVLGSLFMGAPGTEEQTEVEMWAQARFPGPWTELEKTGTREFENGSVHRQDRLEIKLPRAVVLQRVATAQSWISSPYAEFLGAHPIPTFPSRDVPIVAEPLCRASRYPRLRMLACRIFGAKPAGQCCPSAVATGHGRARGGESIRAAAG
nr:complex i intermediate-associated protein 84, mitochondrial [Quercus suber]